MLRRLVPFLAVLLAGCSASNLASNAAHHPPKKDWTITVTFNYDFTNFVPCSATVTKGCITGFQWGYTQSGGTIPLKTSPPSICTGTTQPEVCTDTTNALLGIGSDDVLAWFVFFGWLLRHSRRWILFVYAFGLHYYRFDGWL